MLNTVMRGRERGLLENTHSWLRDRRTRPKSCRPAAEDNKGEVIGFISIHTVPIREKGTASTTGLARDDPGDSQQHEDSNWPDSGCLVK